MYLLGGYTGTVSNNILTANTTGISINDTASPTITLNTITQNTNGIYFNGSLAQYPNPIVNNNSIYSNTSYDLNANSSDNTSSKTINAQNNWLGTIDPLVIASKVYDFKDNTSRAVIDYTPILDAPNGNPRLPLYFNTTLKTFLNPGVDTITFDVKADEYADWTITIQDSQNVTVKTFAAANTKTMTAPWTGLKDDNVTLVDDGLYTFTINANSSNPLAIGIPLTGYIVVNRNGYINQITNPIEGGVLTGNTNVITGSANASNFTKYVLSYATTLSGPWTTLITSTSGVSNTTLYTWDTKNVVNGNYVLRLETTYNTSQVATLYVNFTLDKIVISGTSVTPEFFNPYLNQTSNINYTLDRNANVTIKIYKYSDNSLQRTLVNNSPRITGPQTEIWDGKNDAGQTVVLDVFYYTVEANNEIGRIGTYAPVYVPGSVTIENSTLTPPNFDPFKGEIATITYDLVKPAWATIKVGRTGQPNYDRLLINNLPRNITDNVELWDGRNDSSVIVGPNTYVVYGTTNLLPDNAIVTEDKRLQITNIKPNPYTFLPQYSEDTTIFYDLNLTATVTVQILDAAGAIVRTIISDQPQNTGTQSVVWDGENSIGQVVNTEGNYTVKITAIAADSGKTIIGYGNVTVYK